MEHIYIRDDNILFLYYTLENEMFKQFLLEIRVFVPVFLPGSGFDFRISPDPVNIRPDLNPCWKCNSRLSDIEEGI